MAYIILPFLLFGVVVFGISNKGNTHAYIKIGNMWPYCLQSVHFPAGDASFDAKRKSVELLSVCQSDYRKAGGLTGAVW